METKLVCEYVTALPTEEFGCRASGEHSRPVLCLVERSRMQMGRRQGVGDRVSKEYHTLLSLVRFIGKLFHFLVYLPCAASILFREPFPPQC